MNIETSAAQVSAHLGISLKDARKHAREIPEIDARHRVVRVVGPDSGPAGGGSLRNARSSLQLRRANG